MKYYFQYTGYDQSMNIPNNAVSMLVEAWGGGGAVSGSVGAPYQYGAGGGGGGYSVLSCAFFVV